MSNVTKDTNMCRVMMNAMIGWMVDSDLVSPMNLLCDATLFDTGAMSPRVDEHGHIVLNISGQATRDFRYVDTGFSFKGTFQGTPVPMHVPYEAVLGFMLPVDGEHSAFFGIPNMERIFYAIEMGKVVNGQLREAEGEPAKQLEATPFAVVGVETHDAEGKPLPTVTDLMTRQPLNKQPKVDDTKPKVEVVKPLLDFGNVGGFTLPTPKQRRVGAPHLTLIQGGKKDN